MTNGNDPSSPLVDIEQTCINQTPLGVFFGLTKREYFAAMAMQSFLGPNLPVDRCMNESNDVLLRNVSEASVKAADALISALNNNTQKP